MIKRGFEITIFILIFFASAILLGDAFLQMKAELPLNAGMTVEEVIKSTYPEIENQDLEYNYKIENDYLLLYRETVDGACEFQIGYKNDDSGYIFELPGVFLTGDIYKIKIFPIGIEEGYSIFISVYKYFDDYILEFNGQSIDGMFDANYYCNGDIIESFNCEFSDESRCIFVVNNTSHNYKFTCQYNGKSYDLADMQTIIDSY